MENNEKKSNGKKMASIALAGAMVIPMAMVPADALKNDYSNHWAKTTIQKWVDMGYVKGVGNQGVMPNKTITRAEFVRMVNQRYGYTKMAEKNNFTDVTSSKWFYNDVLIAQKEGYIAGLTATTFDPQGNITREQAISIVARILGLKDNTTVANKFKDAYSISGYAKGAVGAVIDAGIIAGYEDGTIKPKKNLTRAEAMIILEKVYDLLGKKDEKVADKDKDKDKDEAKKQEDAKKPSSGNGGGSYEVHTSDSSSGSPVTPVTKFTVTFIADGKTVTAVTVKKGETLAEKPSVPVKEGCTFLGWFKADGSEFKLADTVSADTTVYAKYAQNATVTKDGVVYKVAYVISAKNATGTREVKPVTRLLEELNKDVLSDYVSVNLDKTVNYTVKGVDKKGTRAQAIADKINANIKSREVTTTIPAGTKIVLTQSEVDKINKEAGASVVKVGDLFKLTEDKTVTIKVAESDSAWKELIKDLPSVPADFKEKYSRDITATDVKDYVMNVLLKQTVTEANALYTKLQGTILKGTSYTLSDEVNEDGNIVKELLANPATKDSQIGNLLLADLVNAQKEEIQRGIGKSIIAIHAENLDSDGNKVGHDATVTIEKILKAQ